MPEFFLELFSEEIPARMQARAAEDLARLTAEALAALSPADVVTWYGPRRIALAAQVAAEVAASQTTERGPRASAPPHALDGFLRKHGATREQLRREGDYWVLHKATAAVTAPSLIAAAIPPLLRRFPWPKSMRWGEGSAFTWVRPLRRITCLLGGLIVPFDLRDGDDDGHGLAAANLTEGHRFQAPDVATPAQAPIVFAVDGGADWSAKLRAHRVLVDAAERRRLIADGIHRLAAERQLTVVDDPGLLDEVAGLVEWPVPLLGRIADQHMDLPAEVMQVSMRVNQRYFALRLADGRAAPWFAFAANVEAPDGGATIIAGNERVLRARFADARHFWDLDRKTPLADRIPLLEHVTFHARLGSQGDRVRRLKHLAQHIAPLVHSAPALAERGAELAKADLVSGMVGEFPELQGVMGRYYALHDGEDRLVADAIRDHYAPKGPSDAVPANPVSIAVALADKLDLLAGFFAIGEKPTGAGDPYALRRAGLGIIRIVRENRLRLRLLPLLEAAGHALPHHHGIHPVPPRDILEFLAERLRVQLRAEGARHDVLAAVFAATGEQGPDDDLADLLARADAVTELLTSEAGADLLTAYRRAANILRIEERKDGPHRAAPDPSRFREPAENDLGHALTATDAVVALLRQEQYGATMAALARLRGPVDAFFDRVTVNASEPDLRRNRLYLLNLLRATMDRVADFSRIEG
ncbi:MAG TPA: glycine--tRNA ligase subunit beta [Acetobacteraceae bacterium]|nr:glycine--tRNA ligase subunit beta [Acetobacteraceae bacterium]